MVTNPAESAIFLTHLGPFDAGQASQLRALAQQCQSVGENPPFNDQTLMTLASADAAANQVAATVWDSDQMIGAAISNDGVMEMAVAPDYRGQGLGTALLEQLRGLFADNDSAGTFNDLNVWAHGQHPAAGALAAKAGFTPVRELWKMSIPASTDFPAAEWADGITWRTFQVGQDEQAWLELNAEAFADHPEQGKMTLADLQARQQEPWFRADGFFLAEDHTGAEPKLVGFHWTKLEPPVGEVYVVGVSPHAQGKGLGKSLTLVGLNFLKEHAEVIELYVDAENTAAVSLYQKLGFTVASVDVMYKHGNLAA